jgi:hypothetical protein
MASTVNLTTIGDFLFRYAYPVSFIGALFLCTTQFFNVQLETIFSFEFATFLYIFIGASGFVSIFNWFGTNIPLIGTSVLNPNTIKINN